MDHKAKRKFIPGQIGAHNRCATILHAMQMRKNEISKYKVLIAAIDNVKMVHSIMQEYELREVYTARHDRLVGSYRLLLSIYTCAIADMLQDCLDHANGEFVGYSFQKKIA